MIVLKVVPKHVRLLPRDGCVLFGDVFRSQAKPLHFLTVPFFQGLIALRITVDIIKPCSVPRSVAAGS